MTERQIKVLNNMVGHSPTGRYTIVMDDGSEVTLSVEGYDPMTNQGVWTLSYSTHWVDLYSCDDISPYDSNVLRYMYDVYIGELKGSLLYNVSN